MKYIKILVGIILTCFSFYYTNEIISYFDTKNPIYKEIYKNIDKLNTSSVNAIIEDNYITAEKNGKKIDINKSLKKMRTLGEYNENLLVFINDYPDISIKNNYDKFIINGNNYDKNISLVFKIEKNNHINEIINILKNNNITGTFFIDTDNIKNLDKEIKNLIKTNNYISNGGNNNNYEKINLYNNMLENYTSYKIKYCLSLEDNINTLNICSKNNMHTIKPKITTYNKPYTYIKNNLSNGNIFYLEDNLYTINELDLIIKYIKQKGYNILNIDELLNV